MLILVLTTIQPDLVGLQFNGGGIEFFESLKHFKLNIPPELRDYYVKNHIWTVKDKSVFNAWLDRVHIELPECDLICDSPEEEAQFLEALNTEFQKSGKDYYCPP